MGVETGGCPHTAIRENASMSLAAIEDMNRKFPHAELCFVESGGDNPKSGASVDHLQGIKTVKSRDNGVPIRGEEACGRVAHNGLKARRRFSTVRSTVGRDFDAKPRNSAQRTAKAKLRII
jgi:hypothetical protein